MVKIISYQKVLAASGAEDLPKLGRGHTRMLLTWQGMVDMVDLLAGKGQQAAEHATGLGAEEVLDWLRSAEALPKDQWDTRHAYDGSVSDDDDGAAADATQQVPA